MAEDEGPSAPPGYRLIRALGSGAMGVVYHAEQVQLARPVALKLIKPAVQGDAHAVTRMRREALAMGKLAHPNLVRIYDAGDGDTAYIAMELVEGGTLNDLLRDRPVEARTQADRLFEGLAGGVAALHAAGLLHRDLKPGNIMIAADGRPLVMDLGLVKDLAGDGTLLTAAGSVVGTPGYLAPEIVEGKPASPASDVWALGCIYWALYAGAAPFRAQRLVDLLEMIRAAQLPDVAFACPDMPAHRRSFVLKLLARDPGERPRDARAALALFGRDPSAARRPSRPSRVPSVPPPPRPRTRHLVAALAAIALSLAAAWALRPATGEALARRAFREFEAGRFNDASALLRRAEELAPAHPLVLCGRAHELAARGDVDRAAELAQAAAELAGDEPRIVAVHLGLLIQQGRLEPAVTALEAALARWPGSPAFAGIDAALRLARHDRAGAESAARRAVELAPGDAVARVRLARIVDRPEDHAAALALLDEAEKVNPQSSAPGRARMAILDAAGRVADADAEAERLLERFPEDSDVPFEAGGRWIARKKLDRAEAALRRAVRVGSWSAWGCWSLAVCLREEGKGAEAEAVCRQALERAPQFAPARALLAELLEKRGDDAGAERVWCEEPPGGPGLRGRLLRAQWLRARGRVAEAGAVLRPALDQAPDVLEIVLEMDDLARARGISSESQELPRRAFRLAPWSEEAGKRRARADEDEKALNAARAGSRAPAPGAGSR